MHQIRSSLQYFLAVAIISVCLRTMISERRAAQPEADLSPEAIQQRIETHRKTDSRFTVRDADENPIRDAKLSIRQTRHAFLFGCNIFGWGKQADQATQAAYRRQYRQLLNFATLPFYWPNSEPIQGQPQHQSQSNTAFRS